MVPFGQATAAGISAMGRPLLGYSVNVAGSLVGILSYTFVTTVGTPPLVWFVPVGLACLALPGGREQKRPILGLAAALTLVLLPSETPAAREFWSTYQKLNLIDGRFIVVNNTGYQTMIRQVAPTVLPVDRFTMPYAVQPGGRVLIVGAGSGNDAAAALLGGATSVTAVEIDPAIHRLGGLLHPQRPYSDPRVRVVIDDARHYLKTTQDRFDLIVFSHLDAHTVLSSYTNVRLDNYIYTVEAFREARSHLAEGGVLYVSFFSEIPFIGARIGRNLTEAFGHLPVALEGTGAGERGSNWTNIYFLTGEAEVVPRLEATTASWKGFAPMKRDTASIAPSTDNWPFLPLERPHVPSMMILISLVIFGLSAGFAWRARPPGEPFDGRLFWLGAAFMLLEVHNDSRLALVFVTTWQVNAWVIGAILSLILLANAACAVLARRGITVGRWAVPLLFASLAAAYFVPLEVLLLQSQVVGGLLATLLLSAPIFFAGLVFAEAFSRTTAPGFALGWNVLGAVLGGMAENLSYIWGIPALVPLAALFYLAALVWPRGKSVAVETSPVSPSVA